MCMFSILFLWSIFYSVFNRAIKVIQKLVDPCELHALASFDFDILQKVRSLEIPDCNLSIKCLIIMTKMIPGIDHRIVHINSFFVNNSFP